MSQVERAHSGQRRGLVLGAGAAALVAGVGAAWWAGRGAQGTDGASAAAVWALNAAQPDGAGLSMAAFRGRPVLVNFWATWCPPCVEELPLVDGFFRQHAANGWQVVGLALDKPESVRAFLAKTPVSFPVGILGMGGMGALKALGNTTGGLPFTLVLNARGSVQARKMGQITPTDLQGWAHGTSRS